MAPKSVISGEFAVVFDLYEYAADFYLPNAYVVSKDHDGYLAHIQQKATEETIESFGLTLSPVRKRLFAIIDQLQPRQLEERYKPSRRRWKSLEKLLEDEAARPLLQQYAHRLLDELLSLIVEHQFPISWQVDRKVLVKDFVMDRHPYELQPSLSFARSPQGVRYQLKLLDRDQEWSISSREVIPITNHPAWLFVDYCLVRVNHINGNMVKPFRTKDEVVIPRKAVRTYFQKFIVKVASKAEIEAEGFDVVYHDELLGCRLEPVQNLFHQHWVLSVHMSYAGADFIWNAPREKRTSLEFSEEDIRIVQVRRDLPREQGFLDKLEAFGLSLGEGSYFYPEEETEDPCFLLEWIAERKRALQKAGFILTLPQWEDRQLLLEAPQLQLETDQANDWFDIYGTVLVGEIRIPFLDLVPYIREGRRYFPLPDGKGFLIPQEWMTKFHGLVQFGRKEGLRLRLNKSQYTLLEELGLDAGNNVSEELESDDYYPSDQLKAQLRPYQLEGVRWLVRLYRTGLGACLADDMGLGKTLQTIAMLVHAKEELAGAYSANGNGQVQLDLFSSPSDAEILRPLRAIIILPASLVFNWNAEINKFAPHLTVYRHVGQKRYKDTRLLARFDLILTTYQTALRDVDFLEELEYEYIVLDESQQIKNRESKVFKAINRLNGRHKVSLSGTPIENSLSDLWSQMQFINPDLLGTYNFFRREFITPIERYQNEEKKERLRIMVGPYLLRRTKEEVARDLPPLSTKTFYSEMTGEQKKLYEREKSAARNYLLENFEADNPKYRMIVLQTLTRLRQLVNHPQLVFEQYEKESGKFNDILEHWDVIRRSGHKALFFSSFVQYLDLFRRHFQQSDQAFSWLTGEVPPKVRQAQIERFENEPKVRSFLISIKSGGTGLNLTAADYVFILDPWWNPTTEQQAIARAHRIGQNKHVIAVKFITKGTIEEKILRLQEKKSKLAEDIIENVRRADFSRKDIEYLLE